MNVEESQDLFSDGTEAPSSELLDGACDTTEWHDPYEGLQPVFEEAPYDETEQVAAVPQADLGDEVILCARECLAAQQGRPSTDGLAMVDYILSSTAAMEAIGKNRHRVYRRLADALNSAWSSDMLAPVDYEDIPDIEVVGDAVAREHDAIVALVKNGALPKNPTGAWRTMVAKVQRLITREQAQQLAQACSVDTPEEDLLARFRAMTAPTQRMELINADYSKTAKEWQAAYRTAASQGVAYRVSSGYPVMDYALTQKDADGHDLEARGAFAPGEFHVFGGATGNGKSAWARPLARNMAFDLVKGWGFTNSQVLYAFTEENADIVQKAASLDRGMRFHDLASNITLADVGPSRKRLVHAVWDLVIKADDMSKKLGIPITQACLPYVIFWDYIGGTSEAGEAQDTVAAQINADLAMRGFAQWNVQAMETFSGESFSAYAKRPWPDGMEFFKPVVIVFAQFRKLADPVWYDPTDRNCSVADFVIEMPDGSPGWDVRPGDFRIPTQSELRGSGILANHATGIYTLHRSRPQKNPKVRDPLTGRWVLSDVRARIIPTKVRNSTDLTFFPMHFDSQPSGIRGQFFDYQAEALVAAGQLDGGMAYEGLGDPILPMRPVRTPFDGIAY